MIYVTKKGSLNLEDRLDGHGDKNESREHIRKLLKKKKNLKMMVPWAGINNEVIENWSNSKYISN